MKAQKHDERRATYEEALLEAQLSLIMYDYMKEEGERLEIENELLNADPDFIVPEELRGRCFDSIKKEFAKRKHKKILHSLRKTVGKIAMLVGIISVIYIGLYTTVEAVRIHTLNFVVSTFEDHASITLFSEPDYLLSSAYTPSLLWVPKGFTLVETDNLGYERYENDESAYFEYEYRSLSTPIDFDAENADVIEPIDINGNQGVLVIKNEVNNISIIWLDQNNGVYSFVLSHNMSRDTTVKIAKNIK